VKGATLVSRRPDLLGRAVAALEDGELELASGEGVIQVRDQSDRLLTMYDNAEPNWEWQETANGGSRIEGVDEMYGYAVECRWEDLFVAVVRSLAERLCEQLWVVDGDGVLWSATSIDAGADFGCRPAPSERGWLLALSSPRTRATASGPHLGS
jgi:hypothetical protein